MVLPYFKAGFESGEYCVWLTPDILTEEEARKELSEILSSLGRDPDDRSFEIQSARDLYLADGRFDRERVRVVALGRRSARGCVAYPLCELVFRQRAIGVAEDHAIRLRLTQTDLADALGLTSVHTSTGSCSVSDATNCSPWSIDG